VSDNFWEEAKPAPEKPKLELPPGEHRAPSSRSKESLEQKQLDMAKRHGPGNPNLQKGVAPYNVNRQSLEAWLQDNPSYSPEKKRKGSAMFKIFLEEFVGKGGKPKAPEKGGRERLMMIMDAVYKTALCRTSKNQILAAQLLLTYAYGKPKASDEDLEAIKKGGLTLVYVDRNAIDPEIPMAQEALPPAPPEFIESEDKDGQ
jgi:hypothetical protein